MVTGTRAGPVWRPIQVAGASRGASLVHVGSSLSWTRAHPYGYIVPPKRGVLWRGVPAWWQSKLSAQCRPSQHDADPLAECAPTETAVLAPTPLRPGHRRFHGLPRLPDRCGATRRRLYQGSEPQTIYQTELKATRMPGLTGNRAILPKMSKSWAFHTILTPEATKIFINALSSARPIAATIRYRRFFHHFFVKDVLLWLCQSTRIRLR